MYDHDLILVGGGLANSLIAWALHHRKPDISFLMIEQGETVGGNHTWCYYDTDMTAAQRALLSPLTLSRWPCYDVHFPKYSRRVETPYNSVTSARLHECLTTCMGDKILLNAQAEITGPNDVAVNGRRLTAAAVIDGRGWHDTGALDLAYQKFLGLEVRLDAPHGLNAPIVMDARVAQEDGYRFLYVLPLSSDTILLEDTRYSASPMLDVSCLRDDIAIYAEQHGWSFKDVLREETGVLPITLGGARAQFMKSFESGHALSGLRAGLFHPTTGYSLPDAIRLAESVCALSKPTNEKIRMIVRNAADRNWQKGAFYRLLNRMMFLAAEEETRYLVLERFYRLPRLLIERFYAGETTWQDKMRILIGKPPVRLLPALKSMPPSAARRAKRAL